MIKPNQNGKRVEGTPSLKIYKCQRRTWKDFQCHLLSKMYKLKSQWDSNINLLEYLTLKWLTLVDVGKDVEKLELLSCLWEFKLI